MDSAFDLVETINERIAEHREKSGRSPNAVAVSPVAYRHLVEIKAWEGRIGDLVIGCTPVTEYRTEDGIVEVLIDELLADTAVEVE